MTCNNCHAVYGKESSMRKKVVITGAAGNLGGLLAKNMIDDEVELRLLVHKKQPDPVLAKHKNARVYTVDLADKTTLVEALQGTDVVVHFAGVLFKAGPEKFLPITNTGYFRNLLEVAVESGVKRMILISFPHVEGETVPGQPATGRLDGKPASVHARTRLEEEKLLFDSCDKLEAVSLRVGMVYGRGILMIDAAHWFSRHYLLGVWRHPTWIHLISAIDFVTAVKNAIYRSNINGIYHIGDEGVQTLQQFLDDAADYWGTCKPWRMPLFLIYVAALLSEGGSRITGCKSPLTCDFITIGRQSYYGDTSRMRAELLPCLQFPTYREGIHLL